MTQSPLNDFTACLRADARRILDSWDHDSSGSAKRMQHYVNLFFLSPSFHLVFLIRLRTLIGHVPLLGKLIRKMIWYFETVWFGVDIHPHAQFGPGLYIPHPVGIVVAAETRAGKNLTLLQNVTLGRRETPAAPRLKDNVVLSAGAVAVGDIVLGNNVVIGANSLVYKDVPDNHIAVGVPATARLMKH